MELMWKLRKQGESNGGPPIDSDINQEDEFVPLINIKTFFHVLAKHTLADFRYIHVGTWWENVLPV